MSGWLRNLRLALALPLVFCLTPCALSGIGPENVLLVVNSNSPSSKAIANHYQQLRQIPAINVVYLDWAGPVTLVDVDLFRDRILQRVLGQIQKRNLLSQIDCIVYSTDFPYGVTYGKENNDKKHSVGSLTGLTYLAQQVLTKNPGLYTGLDSNWYARPAPGKTRREQTVGFRSQYKWQKDGRAGAGAGRRYFLSVMLGYTATDRGNSLREVISYLRRSALADGTHPEGTIYLMRNDSDIRSKVRSPFFEKLVEDLRELDVDARIGKGRIPQGKSDVAGAVIGTPRFDWGTSGNTILPGAICEHFTSYGGRLSKDGQSPMTDLLRYGAAGASGTVEEPRAILSKFPDPNIHLHYVRGCTLAESFYQAVRGPYQLLIMGDALCRPWATIPVVSIDGIADVDQPLSGTIDITPKVGASASDPIEVREYVVYVDGQEVTRVQDGGSFKLDTTKIPDGYHELRVVAIQDSMIESRGQLIRPLKVDNHGRTIEVRVSRLKIPWNQQLFIEVESPGSKSVYVMHNRRPVAHIKGEKGQARIDPRKLGVGPVSLQVVGISGDPDKTTNVFARPVRLEVVSSPGLPELPRPTINSVSGFRQ